MSYVVNVAINDILVLRDNSNVAITGKATSDFLVHEAFLKSNPATTAPVTITHVATGTYQFSFTPTQTGDWWGHYVYNSGGVYREEQETFSVITAQQADPAAALDPTALADAATAIQTSLDNLTTFIDETADLSTLSESLAALSASAAAIQSAVTAVSTELGDITTINDLQDAVTAINSKIGTISVAQLPLATGTGGAAIWAKEVV
jgi:hypothetical protein